MSHPPPQPIRNSVERRRRLAGWSQAQLAKQARISRAAVSAIETGRNVPSTEVALSLAGALGCRVEDLFSLGKPPQEPKWAWPAPRFPFRYFCASVEGRTLLYPTEFETSALFEHDGIAFEDSREHRSQGMPSRTLVIAGCDPALPLLAIELEHAFGVRLLVVSRSSSQALALLERRQVHLASIHLADDESEDGNERAVRNMLGAGYRLLRHARAEEGVVLHPMLDLGSVRAALHADLRWVGREEGSGARRCLERAFDGAVERIKGIEHAATSHRAVIEAIRGGWADAGVCPRFVAAEAALTYLGVQRENFDLCYAKDLEGDPRVAALLRTVRSQNYRAMLSDLEGYDTASTGELQTVRS